jgi:hypothetical protein
MTTYTLIKTRFKEGIWEGLLTGETPDAPAPDIGVSLLDRAVPDVSVTETTAPGRYALQFPIPREAIGDGVQTLMISDLRSGEVLDSFSIMAGEVLSDDFRSEVSLLRAELDLLKRAFRRHCLETM